MLDAQTHKQLAQELHASERSRQQVEQFSKRHPAMEMADSYAIQREWMKIKLAEGRRVIGHKIGLTSRAMQIASQITEPDYGSLLDDMLLRDGSEVEAARFIVPRFEVEFAFILARALKGPGVTLFDVLNATDYVVPALELIDARIEQFDRVTKAPRTGVREAPRRSASCCSASRWPGENSPLRIRSLSCINTVSCSVMRQNVH